MFCESDEKLVGRPMCGEGFDMGPCTGMIVCELTRGHSSEFHRSTRAGFEWCGRELWPLPPAVVEVA